MQNLHNIHKVESSKSELKEVYISQVISEFAISLISVFIPLYLLDLGFSLENSIIFVIIVFGSFGLLSPFSSLLASKKGLKHSILYRVPVISVFFVMLIYIEALTEINFIFFYLTALMLGISNSLYWMALHSVFVKNVDINKEGQQIGNYMALPRLARVAAPTIGALFLESMGFFDLFWVVVLLLFVSVFPLFASNEYKRKYFRFKLKDYNLSLDRKLSATFLIEGFTDISESVIWPVFIFLALNDLLIVGVASTAVYLGTAIFIIMIGRIADKIRKRKYLFKIGGMGLCMIWIMRIFVTTPMEAVITSALAGIFYSMTHLVAYERFCEKARDKNILQWTSYREGWLAIGRVFILSVFVFLISFNFPIIFVLMALSVALFMFF